MKTNFARHLVLIIGVFYASYSIGRANESAVEHIGVFTLTPEVQLALEKPPKTSSKGSSCTTDTKLAGIARFVLCLPKADQEWKSWEFYLDSSETPCDKGNLKSQISIHQKDITLDKPGRYQGVLVLVGYNEKETVGVTAEVLVQNGFWKDYLDTNSGFFFSPVGSAGIGAIIGGLLAISAVMVQTNYSDRKTNKRQRREYARRLSKYIEDFKSEVRREPSFRQWEIPAWIQEDTSHPFSHLNYEEPFNLIVDNFIACVDEWKDRNSGTVIQTIAKLDDLLKNLRREGRTSSARRVWLL